jgi:xanthine/CO dehydrogenase XdhC/CoxF family maturation factor
MHELQEIVDAARRARQAGEPAILATVVRVTGSAYRRPGARMLLPRGGEGVGVVSGGCLESDLAERAADVLESGRPRTVVYDMRSPDDVVWGLGLGCNGEVRVLLERLDPDREADHLAFLERCLRERRPGVVATVFAGEGPLAAAVGRRLTLDDRGRPRTSAADDPLAAALLEDAREALAERRSSVRDYDLGPATAQAFLEYVPPVVSLLVFGAGGDACPLVGQARRLGWRVTVADDRPAYARPDRFPEADAVVRVRFDALDRSAPPIDAHTPVVVMTHHFLHDLELLRFLLPTEAPYLGLLGPRQRYENLLAELARQGVSPAAESLARVFGPVGIDIGAETPEEIALAAVAEIRAVLSGRAAGFLRDRRAPLHEGPR